MRIESSVVAMESTRQYSSYYKMEEHSLVEESDKAATLDFSDESKSLLKQLNENEKKLNDQEKEKEQENLKKQFQEMSTDTDESTVKSGIKISSPAEMKIEMLRKMIEALRKMQRGRKISGQRNDLKQFEQSMKDFSANQVSFQGVNQGIVSAPREVFALNAPRTTTWTRMTVQSAFMAETENTSYAAQGTVKTADGREINFEVNIEMSRAFCARYESLTKENYITTDPLVFNLDGNIANISDQKFLFDLDSDGKEEAISFAQNGSGFLALDKNHDGKINNGNELFGTQSGNGFKDLAEYDKDGNGWIDENDSVFEDLKIYTKDETGKDKTISLKEAGVGAIYLANASTQFSLNQTETNQTNGFVRSTGIFLKENGGVGTVQHIDLTL